MWAAGEGLVKAGESAEEEDGGGLRVRVRSCIQLTNR